MYLPGGLKERIHKHNPTVRLIHFHEQAVLKRATKWKKAYLTSVYNITMSLYHFLVDSEMSLLFNEQKQKSIYDCHVTCYGSPNGRANSLREIFIASLQ